MKKKKIFVTCLGALVLAVALIYFNQPIRLPALKSLPTAGGNEVNKIGELNKKNLPDKLPNANPSALKGKGDLAFIWEGLLYVIDNNGEIKNLTKSGKAICPQWSFDGKYLAFLRVTDPETNTGVIWITDREGKRTYQVQGLPETVEVGNFKWSPSENLLAVKTSEGIWLIPLEGEPQKLVQAEQIFSFEWSPDGQYLAYNALEGKYQEIEKQGDILYTIDIKKGEKVSQLDLSGSGMGIEVAKWWPDGKGLLYWQNISHSASMRADGLELYSLELGQKKPKNLGITLGYKEWLSFSPERKLLMVGGIGRELWLEKNIVLADTKSGELEGIVDIPGHVSLDPAFSADGKKIAFVAAKEMSGSYTNKNLKEWLFSRTLWVANSDGSNPKGFTGTGEGIHCPMWTKDGSHILYIKDNYLWFTSVSDVKPQRLVGPFSGDELGFYGHANYLDSFSWFQ